MSELTNIGLQREVRRQLLGSVCAAALLVSISAGSAQAASTYLTGSERPLLWLELGGFLEQTHSAQLPFIAPFERVPTSITGGTEQAILQKPSPLDFGWEGKISFQPTGSDWVLSAGIRYGRGKKTKKFHETTVFQTLRSGHLDYPFLDTHATNNENHAVVDFQVGKDVGLGMFGAGSHSVISGGIRIAQFNSDMHGFATSSPRPTFFTHYAYREKSTLNRSTRAFGPSIAWSGTVPLAGSAESGFSMDWDANAAVLFGRQKVAAQFSARSEYVIISHSGYSTNIGHFSRRSNKIIPNAGGMIGLSYRLPAAKLSIGYRADLFFGAVDGGADTRHSSNLSFNGPFASISIGMGD